MLTKTDALPVGGARILEIGRTIGREFAPQEGILFGSYARGDQTADSAIDLLVVFRHGVDKAAEAIRIRRAIGRINTGVDIVVSSGQGGAADLWPPPLRGHAHRGFGPGGAAVKARPR